MFYIDTFVFYLPYNTCYYLRICKDSMLNANQPFKQFVFLLQKWECCYGGDLKKQSIEDLLSKVSKQKLLSSSLQCGVYPGPDSQAIISTRTRNPFTGPRPAPLCSAAHILPGHKRLGNMTYLVSRINNIADVRQ